MGAYLPAAYEEVIDIVNAFILTDKVTAAFTDTDVLPGPLTSDITQADQSVLDILKCPETSGML